MSPSNARLLLHQHHVRPVELLLQKKKKSQTAVVASVTLGKSLRNITSGDVGGGNISKQPQWHPYWSIPLASQKRSNMSITSMARTAISKTCRNHRSCLVLSFQDHDDVGTPSLPPQAEPLQIRQTYQQHQWHLYDQEYHPSHQYEQ